VIEAAKMIDRVLDHGDMDGRDVWRRIRRAIDDLQAQPSKGTLHRCVARTLPPGSLPPP
jgi:hypothetical protein